MYKRILKTRPTNGVSQDQQPQTEVTPRAKRRRFSAQYKLRILEEADRCTRPGEIGALLRREGLYSSNPGDLAPAARARPNRGTLSQEARPQAGC